MDLYERIKLFSQFTQPQKEALFDAAIYNDARMNVYEPKKRLRLIKEISLARGVDLKAAFNKCSGISDICASSWKKDLLDAYQWVSQKSGLSPVERSIVLNKWLSEQGLCPFVHYAFESWHSPSSEQDVHNLADLSTAYLYKLVPVSVPEVDEKFIGMGAYGKIYQSLDQRTVIKYPYNLAAKAFVNFWEAEVYKIAKDRKLGAYLPAFFQLNEESGVIRKSFVSGVSGWLLLENDDFRKQPYEMAQLEEIYDDACAIYREYGVNIDIHPGNFQWNEEQRRWYLVDFGSMPEIGAEYYPRDSFKEYMQKIWFDLHRLMVEVPIRSLDIDVPDNLRGDIRSALPFVNYERT